MNKSDNTETQHIQLITPKGEQINFDVNVKGNGIDPYYATLKFINDSIIISRYPEEHKQRIRFTTARENKITFTAPDDISYQQAIENFIKENPLM